MTGRKPANAHVNAAPACSLFASNRSAKWPAANPDSAKHVVKATDANKPYCLSLTQAASLIE